MVDHPSVAYLRRLFGETTEGPIFLCSLPNDKGKGDGSGRPADYGVKTRHCIGPNCAQQIYSFVNHHDQIGRGTYYTMSTIKEGLQRCKDNCLETPALVIDLDFKSVEAAPAHCENIVPALFCPPTGIIRSGFGLHVVWQLKEALPTQENLDRIEAVLRQLADVIGGDLAVCHPAALLRLPGSHNSKKGDRREVVVASWGGRLYEIDDLEDWLSVQSPVIKRKIPESKIGILEGGLNSNSCSRNVTGTNAYEDFAKSLGFELPLDAAQRLAQMTYQGPEDSGVYATQCAVTMSLCQKEGWTVDKIVTWVIDETRRAAGADGANWNWVREERRVRKLTEDGIKKVEKERALKAMQNEVIADSQLGEEQKAFVQGNIVDLQQAKTRRESKLKGVAQQVKSKKFKLISETLKSVLRDILLFDQEHTAWRYHDGLWIYVDNFKKWIDVEIQKCANGLNIVCDNKLCSEVAGDIQREPEFHRDNIQWDSHGKIPTRSGLVDLETMTLTIAKPEHYCTWRVNCIFNPSATCANWRDMLEDCFADLDESERASTIGCLQELLGVGLINEKPRGLRRALILYGGKNCGKSAILKVFAGLFGDVISVDIAFLKEKHGTMPFRRRLPWILHEAFDQSTWHTSALIKTLITGETFGVNIKNGAIIANQIWHGSIYWATNHPPQFKESTDAMVSRILPIHCRTRFDDESPVGIAAMAREDGFAGPAELVIGTELPGVFVWAMDGLRRAMARGRIETSQSTQEEKKSIWRDSNLVARFIEDCTEYSPWHRIPVNDFCLAVSVWFGQNKGESRGYMPSNDAISRAVTALHDECIERERDQSARYLIGIKLNDEGEKYFSTGKTSLAYDTKRVDVSSNDASQLIPSSWDIKERVIKMRKAQASLNASAGKNTDGTNG